MPFDMTTGTAAQPTNFNMVTGNTGEALLDFVVPSAEAGSVLLISVVRNSPVFCSDNSWTKLREGIGANGLFLDVFVRLVDGTNGSNPGDVVSFLSLTMQELQGNLAVLTDVKLSSLIVNVAHQSFTDDTTPDAPSLFVENVTDTVLCIWSVAGTAALTPPVGFVEIDNYGSTVFTVRTLLVAARPANDVGEYIPGEATTATAVTGRAFSIAIRHFVTEPVVDVPPVKFNASPDYVVVIAPTAANVVLMAAENIVDNLRVRQPASLTLPSLYKRAFMITREVDEFALVKVR